ncbi:MAG: regulatory protein RecX [Acidobacteriota bacterium]|nr:regulatory protein RecX [Acidobacteriota bacterium]
MKAGIKTLYSRALRLLARRSHSRFELRYKLKRKHPSTQVEELLDHLEETGLIDDESFALERALFRRQRRHWGNLRVSQDLKRAGIDARIIDRVLEQVNQKRGEVDSLQEAITLWVNKSGEPKFSSSLKKLYNYCVRLGYASHMIRHQLEPYFEHISWSQEDENGL